MRMRRRSALRADDERPGRSRLHWEVYPLCSWMRQIALGIPLVGQHIGPTASRLPVTPPSRGPQALVAAFRRYDRAYFQRWLLIGALIGVVAGVGAILFAAAISLCTHWLLGGIAGYIPPSPAGEGATVITAIQHRWLLPVVTTLGGLLTGLIVFTLAPEAEGHGTDAAIEAFHAKGGFIRPRVPLVKIVASAITIGSGGSAGREGPTAQISAGFGSWLGGLLRLDEHDRRIAEAAGIGAGIGAIFKAPFGGALLSAEILYKRDFEADALFPAFVASATGFAIYGAWAGWTPVFGPGGHFEFTHPASLGGYLILGLCAGLVGLLYPKTLYGLRDLFKRIPIPPHFKPALGGLLVGLIGLVFPQALGMGYGYAQFAINGDFVTLAAWLMAALVFVKILTTSLTIGSGGSGGVFGPGMVIGGFLGGALWAALHTVAPGLVTGTNAGAFVVVGMGAFFGGIAKAPLAVILMVAEMTGEYALIAPAMLATMIAYVVTGDTSIYESQVPTRLDSPAHKDDYALPLLQSLTVRDALQTADQEQSLATATPDTSLAVIARLMREHQVASVPIERDGRLVGIVTAEDLTRVPSEDSELARARQVMSRVVARAFPTESLYDAWLRMSRRGLRQLPVVEPADPTRLLGLVTSERIAQLLQLPRRGEPPHAELVGVVAATPTTGEDSSELMPPHALTAGTDEPPDSRDAFARTRVGEVMLTTPRLVRQSDPLSLARQLLEERGAALMVTSERGALVGIITRSDMRGVPDRRGDHEVRVGEVAVRNLVTAHPDESLGVAVRRMNHLGLRQLPVAAIEAGAPPLGLLRRSDILVAYEVAADEKTGKQPNDETSDQTEGALDGGT